MALPSGRYTFCHNAILRVIVHEMQVMINQVKKEVTKIGKDSAIIFVKEGKQHKTWSRKYYKLGISHKAKDWVMEETSYSHLLIKVKRSDINS